MPVEQVGTSRNCDADRGTPSLAFGGCRAVTGKPSHVHLRNKHPCNARSEPSQRPSQVGERDSMVMVAAVLGELTRAWDTASHAHLADLLASREG